MNQRTMTGSAVLGVLAIVGLGVVGLYGIANGYLFDSSRTLLAPTLGTAVVTAIVIITLAGLGAQSGKPVETAYW